jgi:flagellin
MSDLTRIAGNVAALNSLNSLNQINTKMALHQSRLATGKRINTAADDPAGLTIATKMKARSEGLVVAQANIGDAQNLLAVAESGLGRINDILVQMRNKAEAGATDTIGVKERKALVTQMEAYAAQIDDIVEQTKWNDNQLINGDYGNVGGQSLTFQTGADKGDVTLLSGLNNMKASDATGLNIATQSAAAYAGSEQQDIYNILAGASSVAAATGTNANLTELASGRLPFTPEQVATAQITVEASYNRIMYADMAAEQVEAS